MHCSVMLFPEPDGPNTTVRSCSALKATSSSNTTVAGAQRLVDVDPDSHALGSGAVSAAA